MLPSKKILCIFYLFSISLYRAQSIDSIQIYKDQLDSIYIDEVQEMLEPNKVLHAEPLYIDLIRDLGARKGEKEWNIGLGMTDNTKYDEYTALVEFEFAPIDRLGFEVELPFSFYYQTDKNEKAPLNKLNSLKLATQYSFLVSQKLKTSLAIGYLHEFTLIHFEDYGRTTLFDGNIFNPFFIAAKRWGQNFHTLLYSGPKIFQPFGVQQAMKTIYQNNLSFHYMVEGTRNFVGVEFNNEINNGNFYLTMRPQMRVCINDHLLIGIVTGIPINKQNERLSTFLRLIYEPKH
ncbi:MAG: phosphoribosylformylglycinamidine synthase [Bacteroidia bacterium]|jgi:hypothetical protein|nr:phosphoribosylformylglycinamidine synthase [Bacteroidia bacterium]